MEYMEQKMDELVEGAIIKQNLDVKEMLQKLQEEVDRINANNLKEAFMSGAKWWDLCKTNKLISKGDKECIEHEASDRYDIVLMEDVT